MKKASAWLIAGLWFAAIHPSIAQSWAKAQHVAPNYYAIRQQFLDFWKGKKPQKGQGYSAFKRWEWHWQSRILPDGTFPPSNIEETEWNNYLASLPESKTLNGANWESLGPNSSNSGYNGIGRVNCVAANPADNNILWLGTPAGGLWKSTDGGASWATNTDNLPVLGVTAIAIDPTDPAIMYIGTGDGIQGDTRSRGILKSTDGGITWNTTGLTLNITTNVSIRQIAIHPGLPNVVVAAASNGIYRTENGGTNWKKVTVDDFFDLKFSPGLAGVAYAASDDKLYTSVDGGLTWTNTFTVPNSDRLAIAVTPANPAQVAAVSSSGETDRFGAFNGLYVSVDTGFTYDLRSSSPNILDGSDDGSGEMGQGWYDLCIAVSPADPDLIFVGGVNIWKSTNGGATWGINTHWYNGDLPGVQITHADKHTMTWVGNNLYNGCDGGLYFTGDDGESWTDISSNLTISQMYRLGVSQSDSKVICGLQDNGTKLRNNAGLWTDNIGGDGMECFIHPTNSNIMYGEWQNGNLHRSTNGGNSWTNIRDNLPGQPQGAWITPFVIDPNNSSTIYAGFNDVYKSVNQGNTWTVITPPELNLIFDLQHIAVAPSTSETIYISDGDQVYRTTDGGAQWNVVTNNLPTANALTYLTVHPSDPNTVYVTFGGYTPNSKVFRSVNGGATWTNISTGLPNLPANCVIVQPNTGVLYLGMDVGVYRREPGAASWELFNTGLPNVIVNELEIRHQTGKIFAATYGRGLWQSDLAPFTPSLALNPVILEFPAQGDTQTITLTTNCDWAVTGLPAWLTVSPASGPAGTLTLTISATANVGPDSQAVVLNFSGCNGQATQSLTVLQAGATVGVNAPGLASCNSVVCRPNPAFGAASFVIRTDQPQSVRLDILAPDGRVISSLKDIAIEPGENVIPWHPDGLAAGNYLYRCYFEKEVAGGTILLAR